MPELVAAGTGGDGGVFSLGVDDDHGLIVPEKRRHNDTGAFSRSWLRDDQRMTFQRRSNRSAGGIGGNEE